MKNQASLENLVNLSLSYLGQISCGVLEGIEIMLYVLRCHKFMFTFNQPSCHGERKKGVPNEKVNSGEVLLYIYPQ